MCVVHVLHDSGICMLNLSMIMSLIIDAEWVCFLIKMLKHRFKANNRDVK